MRYRVEPVPRTMAHLSVEVFNSVPIDRPQTATGSSVAQIREPGLAIVHMAQQRVGEHDARLNCAATVIKEIEQ